MRNYKQPIFTEKHFNILAEFLKANKHSNKENLIENLIGYFKQTNSKFNEQRFLKAINKENKIK